MKRFSLHHLNYPAWLTPNIFLPESKHMAHVFFFYLGVIAASFNSQEHCVVGRHHAIKSLPFCHHKAKHFTLVVVDWTHRHRHTLSVFIHIVEHMCIIATHQFFWTALPAAIVTLNLAKH